MYLFKDSKYLSYYSRKSAAPKIFRMGTDAQSTVAKECQGILSTKRLL